MVGSDLDRLRARLAALAPGGLLIAADGQGLIAHVDAPLAERLGWRVDELVGRPLTAIIPRRLHDAHHVGFSRFLATAEPKLLDRRLPLPTAARDGTELAGAHVITALRSGDGWVFAAAIELEERRDGT